MASALKGHPALNTSSFRFAVMIKPPFKESKKTENYPHGTAEPKERTHGL
jgi:hypothetical protein